MIWSQGFSGIMRYNAMVHLTGDFSRSLLAVIMPAKLVVIVMLQRGKAFS